jgi:ABC-type transporter Mla MlaB component
MPEEFSVWMHDVADGPEVVIKGPVVPKTAWSLWRTLEAACAMSPAVTVNLAKAAPVDATVLADLLAMRDDLAACDRTLTLSGLRPTDQEPSHAAASDRRARRAGTASLRSHDSRPKLRANPRGVVSSGRRPTTEDHDDWRLGRDTSREAEVAAQMTARLHERFPLLPEDVVERAVTHRYRTYGTARIRDFVEILVEREVGDDLGRFLA